MIYLVYSFTFHLSGLCPYDDDHLAMDQLISLCLNRGYTFKVTSKLISSVDRSYMIDVHMIPEKEARQFYAYSWYKG